MRSASKGSCHDKDKALSLLQEAVQYDGWRKCSGLIALTIDALGGKKKVPLELHHIYDDATAVLPIR